MRSHGRTALNVLEEINQSLSSFCPISSDKFPLEATSQIQELVAVQILFLYIPYAVIEFQTF